MCLLAHSSRTEDSRKKESRPGWTSETWLLMVSVQTQVKTSATPLRGPVDLETVAPVERPSSCCCVSLLCSDINWICFFSEEHMTLIWCCSSDFPLRLCCCSFLLKHLLTTCPRLAGSCLSSWLLAALLVSPELDLSMPSAKYNGNYSLCPLKWCFFFVNVSKHLKGRYKIKACS